MLKRWAAGPPSIWKQRWAHTPPGTRWLVRLIAAVLAVAIVWALVWALFVPVADWVARHDVGSAKPALLQTARDAARGRLLTLVAGLFAAGALVFTALNFTLSRRTFELTEQGQVTDRFTKAIEQLGSDKLDVRIGGIYALERVARDSARDQPTVTEVLTAFIREHSREQWPRSAAGQPVPERSTRPDVQAAITVVGRLVALHPTWDIDLTAADLTRADLGSANLYHAKLTNADLTGANLGRANLAEARLTGADLTGADLTAAKLTNADLTRADLTGAFLVGAKLAIVNLTGAILTGAHFDKLAGAVTFPDDPRYRSTDLTGADLAGANLTCADLTGAHLGSSDLTGANLIGANLTGADLTRVNLTRARWSAAEPVPEGWTIERESGRLKSAGQLSEVTAHYL